MGRKGPLERTYDFLIAKDIRDYFKKRDEFEGKKELKGGLVKIISDVLDEILEEGIHYLVRYGVLLNGAVGIKLIYDAATNPEKKAGYIAGGIFLLFSGSLLGWQAKLLQEKTEDLEKKIKKIENKETEKAKKEEYIKSLYGE